jgi:hypothetical protein
MKMKTKNITTLNLKKSTSRSPFGRGFVLTALALGSLALSPTAWTQSSVMESNSRECSQETLKGDYMSQQSGTLNGLPYTQVNRVFADGNGSLTGSGTAVVNGVVSFPVVNGTYTINSDCTGTVVSVVPGLSQNIVVKEDGSQVFIITTAHPAGVGTISGEAVRLSKK